MEVTNYGNNNYCTLRRELCFRADNRAQLGQIYDRVKTCTYQTIRTPRVIYDRCTENGTQTGSKLFKSLNY